MASPTHIVVHPKLFMRTNGKLQAIPVGSKLSLSASQAKAFGNKVQAISVDKPVEIDEPKQNAKPAGK